MSAIGNVYAILSPIFFARPQDMFSCACRANDTATPSILRAAQRAQLNVPRRHSSDADECGCVLVCVITVFSPRSSTGPRARAASPFAAAL